MHGVTVIFEVKPDHAAEFRTAMAENARASVEIEPGCHPFDISDAADSPTTCFLYELYADEAAFKAHLATAHFRAFDVRVAPWLASKTVRTCIRDWP